LPFFTTTLSPPRSTLFPYTTLFRSRRGEAKQDDERLTVGPITVDPARYEVSVNGKRINLTSLEFKLLRTLMQRRGRVQARDRLRSEEHTSELQSPYDLVCRLLLEKK